MRIRTLTSLTFLVLALLPALPAGAGGVPNTIYVDINATCSDATIDSSAQPYCNIEAAVDDANPGDTIEVAAGIYLNHDADSYVVDITVPVTINGAGIGNTVINGNFSDRGVRVWDVTPVTITGVTIASADGGGVLVTGSGGLTLEDSEVKNSSASTGAGFYVYSGATVTLDTVTVDSTAATGTGGGMWIAAAGTDIDIIDSTFSLNSSGNEGGAIAFSVGAGTLDISGSEFLGNDANSSGGAISISASGSTINIDTTVFHDNGDNYQGGGTDTGIGGAIRITLGTLIVDQSLFYENEADNGGAIAATPDTVTVRNSTIHANHANTSGGGLRYFKGVIENSTITNNTSDGSNGGVDGDSTDRPTVRNSIIAGNTANAGAQDCDSIELAHYSLIGDSTGCAITTNVNTLVDTDPELLALADNGGPTMTRAFEAGAPPHDAADPADPESDSDACRTVDQRGENRNDARCDIGAFELEAVEPTVGLVDVSQGIWHLRDESGTVTSFYYGNSQDRPVAGDWDGDGIDTPGLFRQSDGFFYARNTNDQGPADDECFAGNPSDVPLAGDWDGDGDDTLGIYRPSNQMFYLFNITCTGSPMGAAQIEFLFGNSGDTPVTGDWDDDGVTEIGLYRESTGYFYWRDTNDTGIATGEIYFGNPGDRFIAGDWGVVDGVDTPAIFRPSTGTFYFRHTLTQGPGDSSIVWGSPTWVPIAGVFGLG